MTGAVRVAAFFALRRAYVDDAELWRKAATVIANLQRHQIKKGANATAK